MIKNIVIVLLVLLNVNSYSDNKKLSNAEASYIFYYKDIAAGTMDLSIKNQKDVINISTTYDGNFLASLANKGYRKETSLIKKQNGKLLPKEYTYTDDNETYEIIFNDNTAKLSSEYFEGQDIKSRNKIYDPISMLVILMQSYPNIESTYSVISKKNLKIYDYKFNNDAIYKINDEVYNCYSAEYKSGNKINYYYFSKEHKNLLIAIKINKNNKEKIRIDLSEIHNLD